jgi:hypothetical protein
MMKKVAVSVYEVHTSTYVIEVEDSANIHEEAIIATKYLIEDGFEPAYFDYSHTLEPETWKTFVVDN